MMAKKMKLVSDPRSIEVDPPNVKYFDKDGDEVTVKERAVAKTEDFEGKTYYYVLRNGFHLVHVLNDDFRSRRSWNFSLVSEDCFNSYINFLRTKKQASYNNAEGKSHGWSR